MGSMVISGPGGATRPLSTGSHVRSTCYIWIKNPQRRRTSPHKRRKRRRLRNPEEMWFGGGLRKLLRPTASGSDGGGSLFVRYMSRRRAINVRKINPKVPIQEAYSISESLYNLIKQHGPLSVPNTWIRAKEAGIEGLNSKTHMKLLLKWMRGKNMLKLICNHVGSSKRFAHCTLPEDPQSDQPVADHNPSRNPVSKKKNKQPSRK